MPFATTSRRTFLQSALAGAALGVTGGCVSTRKKGLRLDKVFDSYLDSVTGARVFNLTPGSAQDQTVYQTHPMWTPNMEFLLFNSNRSGGPARPHAVEMKTGEIRPIIPDTCGLSSMTWRSGILYYLLDRDLYAVDVAAAFRRNASPRRIGALPADCVSPCGSVTIDAREKTLYVGAVLEPDKRWGIFAIDVVSGAAYLVIAVDFQVGHLQANPFVTGEIMFCHETGGQAPQRTWFVRADGRGLTPFYKETGDEWVTHEVWWGPDRALFTIWPYDEAHKQQPHGVAWTTRDAGSKGALDILSQYPAWHTHGSPDLQWAMGDDFNRNIWLINAHTKERRLLTQGHLGKDCKTHPHGSFSIDGSGIVFTSSRNGVDDIFFVEIPPFESLPPLAAK